MKPAIERGEKCYKARLTEEQVRLARIYVMQDQWVYSRS